MRLVLAALFTLTSALHTAQAATQQQCEALLKPIEMKVATLPNMREGKPSVQDCARASEVLKLYVNYQTQADRLNCPFAYLGGGQTMGGAPERAELIASLKKVHSEKCR